MGGKNPGKYPTADNWVVGNTFRENGNAVSLGGMRGNGATDNLFAENDIDHNGAGWGCNGALVGNNVLTSDTTDPRSSRLDSYSAGNVSFFAEPPPLKPLKTDDRENTTARWVHGAMVAAAPGSSVCSTSNGCTPGAFLSCPDMSQVITSVTFASYGNPTECPAPQEGTCSHPDSMKVAKAACLGKTNCTVDKKKVGDLSCSDKIASGTDNMIVTALCGDGKERRANLLRYEFNLADEVSSAEAVVSALGYQVLFCNGQRVSKRLMDPGRTSANHVFFSRLDLTPHLRKGTNVLAAALGNGWEANEGNQPGAIQQPPALYLDATITLAAATASEAAVRVVSNASWSSGLGLVTYDSVYQGERRDMRTGVSMGSASTSGFDAEGWKPVVVGGTDKTLAEQTRPAVTELMALKAVSVKEINISSNHAKGGSKTPSCGTVEEDTVLQLSCPNSTIKAVLFAQYGTPDGDCPASGLKKNSKCARDLTPALTDACVGKESCQVECRSCGPQCPNSCSVDKKTIVPSHDPCPDIKKSLAAAVSCAAPATPPPAPPPTKHGFLVDFGQNIAGVVRLKTPAQPKDGQVITVRHCEVLEHPPLSNAPLGQRGCYYGELVNALNTDVYTLSSDKARNGDFLQPEFTIHGFRHAEITGLESLAAEDIEAVVIGSSMAQNSSLRLGSELLQKIQNATVWGHRANTQDIFTDCNQRDERLGWMGDAAISAEAASYNFPGMDGVAGVQAQFLDMIADGQGDDGAVSDITPTVWQLGAMQPSDASWGSAFPTMAYRVWMTTGRTDVIKKHLPSLVKYIDSLSSRLKSSGMAKNNLGHYGDWFPPSNGQKGSTELVSAGAFIQDTRHVAAMAGAVGDTKTQSRLTALVASTVKEFHAAWLSHKSSDPRLWWAADRRIGNGGQTDIGTALWLDVVPPADKSAVVEALVKDIQKHGYHTTSGILGTRSVYEALAMNGRMDVALAMLNQTSFPSFGFMVDNPYEPSTTLWEKWGASNLTDDQGDSSRNHVMYGAISAFFWKHLGGITPASAGWTKVRVAPSFGELCEEVETSILPAGGEPVLDTVDATLGTVAGDVHVHWELQDAPAGDVAATAVLRVSVPVGAEDGAEVVVPCVGRNTVITEALSGRVVWRDGGRPAEEQLGGRLLSARRSEHGGASLFVTSGDYRFVRSG